MGIEDGGREQAEDDDGGEGDEARAWGDFGPCAEFDGCDEYGDEEDIDHAPSADPFDEAVGGGAVSSAEDGGGEGEDEHGCEFEDGCDDGADEDDESDDDFASGEEADDAGPDVGGVGLSELFDAHDGQADGEGVDDESCGGEGCCAGAGAGMGAGSEA